MPIPEIKCATRCLNEVSYRKLLWGIAIAVGTFTLGVWLTAWLVGPRETRKATSSTVLTKVIVMPHTAYQAPFEVKQQIDVFSSPDEAAREFERRIHEAGGYRDLRSCHDQNGRRGKRVVLMTPTPNEATAFWRVVWMFPNNNSTALYMLESDSLQKLRAMEGCF